MLEWLLAPIDATRPHELDFFVSWHGRFMVMAWAFLIPTGIIAARFFKVLPKQPWPEELDNKTWWNLHRLCQYSSALLIAIATMLILYRSISFVEPNIHKQIGWLVIALTTLQILSGIFRGTKGGPTEPAADGSLRGDHFDMTRYRVIFEYYHKLMGYLLLLSATYCIITGMWISNAPRWMWFTLACWWVLTIIVAGVLQRKGACFDTYKAIWGSDSSLPGNQRKPIGLGVNNHTPWQ